MKDKKLVDITVGELDRYAGIVLGISFVIIVGFGLWVILSS